MSFPFPSSNGEEPPPLKKRASLPLLPQTTISSLPDDLILSCLARVSRVYYKTLSLVSKKFRRLLASPELYEARSLLGRTESCLYVSLYSRYPIPDPDPHWFILCRKPNGKKKKKKKISIGYVLATIPIPRSPRSLVAVGSNRYSNYTIGRNVVAVGSNIYAIGANSCYSYRAPPSSSVSILDCRSHTWQEGPSMRAERKFGHANVCDGKIYVAGGCQDKKDSSNWMEVYDPKTQTWESVPCPVAEKRISKIGKSAVIEGEIFMFENGGKGLAYKPKEDGWTSVGEITLFDCVIDDILYRYCTLRRGIQWYDSNVGLWVNVIGLKGLPKIPIYSSVKLVCYGEKMVVLWLKNKPKSGGECKTVWCGVITLERRNDNEVWGNVESIDEDVLTVPKLYDFECALTATI